MERLVLASQNKGKLIEIRELLADWPFEVISATAFPGLPEVVEDGATFEENAMLKAETVARLTGFPTLADDSGLEVEALGGAPGIYSARYGKPGWSDKDRYRYLLEQLVGVPPDARKARFVSAMAFYHPQSGVSRTTQGIVEGFIALAPRGENGFGYDPVFFLPELNRTMAELSDVEKNRYSHRAHAIRALRPVLADFWRGGA